MFVHICRVCSGGNILVASKCSDVLHIDESSWNTAPVFGKLWGIRREGRCVCLFIAFCGNMMYLFWGGETVQWELYSNEADRDNRHRQTHQPQVIFLKVSVRRITGGKRETGKKPRVIIVAMRTVASDDDGDNELPQFFRGLREIAASLSPLSDVYFSHHVVASSQLCALLFPLHLLRLCFTVWQSYYRLHFPNSIRSSSQNMLKFLSNRWGWQWI